MFMHVINCMLSEFISRLFGNFKATKKRSSFSFKINTFYPKLNLNIAILKCVRVTEYNIKVYISKGMQAESNVGPVFRTVLILVVCQFFISFARGINSTSGQVRDGTTFYPQDHAK